MAFLTSLYVAAKSANLDGTLRNDRGRSEIVFVSARCYLDVLNFVSKNEAIFFSGGNDELFRLPSRLKISSTFKRSYRVDLVVTDPSACPAGKRANFISRRLILIPRPQTGRMQITRRCVLQIYEVRRERRTKRSRQLSVCTAVQREREKSRKDEKDTKRQGESG